MKTTLVMLWTKIKKYWGLLAVILLVLGGFIFMHSPDLASISKKMNKVNDAHDKEVKEIAAARAEETRLAEAAGLKLTETMRSVQEQYEAQNVELDNTKRREIAEMIHKHGGSDDELLEKLARATGFPVVAPKQ